MKRQLLFAAMLAAGALTANAQEDVTATYLNNANFEASEAIDKDVCGYGKDMKTNGTTYYGFQAVDDWSYEVTNGDNSNASFPNSGMIGAVFAYGSEQLMRGGVVSAPASGYTDTSTKGLGFLGVWGLGGYYYQEVTFPAGKYTIDIPVYNQSGTSGVTTYFGFLADNGTTYYSPTTSFTVGEWTNVSVTFSLAEETKGRVSVGYKSNGSGSGANPHLFIDGVSISFTAQVVKDNLQKAIDAITALNSAWESSDIAETISNAQAIMDDESATQDAVNEAAENIYAVINGTVCDLYLPAEYFKNMGFEDCPAETTNWAAGGSANSADYSEYSWARTSQAAWCSSAVVEYGGDGQVNGASAPETEEGGKALGISVGWGSTVSYRNGLYFMPAGAYTITFNAYNAFADASQFQSKNGFVAEDGTEYLSTTTSFPYGEWTTDVVTFILDEGVWGSIQVGGTAISGGSASNAKVFFDNITVEWSDPYEMALHDYNDAIQAAKDAMEEWSDCTTGYDLFYLTGLAYPSGTPDTYDGLVTATEELKSATAKFIDSAPYIIALDKEIGKAIDLAGDDYTTLVDGYYQSDDMTKEQAILNVQGIKVNEYNYVTENFPYSVDLGAWTGSGEGTQPALFSNEHWSGTTHEYCNQDDSNGQGWNASAWTLNYEQTLTLPAGTYVFKVAGRQATSENVTLRLSVSQYDNEIGYVDDFPKNGNKARGITTDGAAGFADDLTFANNGYGYGWEWRYVKFELSGTEEVTIAVQAVATAPQMWVSFGDATLQSDTPTLVIDENSEEFTLAEEGTYNVVLNRTIKEGTNTLILPFEMSEEEVKSTFGENAKVYELSAYEIAENGNETLSFYRSDIIKENIPCLLVTDEPGTSYNIFGRLVYPVEYPLYFMDADNAQLVGVYKAMNAPQSNENLDITAFTGEALEFAEYYIVPTTNYVISNSKSYIVNSDDAAMKITRAYIAIPGYDGDSKSISINLNDGTTGIMDVATGEVTTGRIYDLSGRVVKAPTKGLYIIDGKKILIK